MKKVVFPVRRMPPLCILNAVVFLLCLYLSVCQFYKL